MIELKSIKIAEAVYNQAQVILKLSKEFPGKPKIFIKKYNRRPQRKSKTALVFMKIAITSAMAASQIAIITTQPIQKYKQGGTI